MENNSIYKGQNVPAPTGGFFIPIFCNIPEESFILSSSGNSAQTGDKRQVRTTRTRKTGSGNLNHTIRTWFCQQKRVSLSKIQVLYIIL